MPLDPFTQVQRALLAIFQKSPLMLDFVKPANIVDMTADQWQQFNPLNPSPSDGQLPELLIVPHSFNFRPFASNRKISEATKDFALWLTTSTLRTGGESAGNAPTLHSCEFALMATMGGQPHDNLGLPGLIKGWTCMGGKEIGLTPAPLQRGSLRFTAILLIRVEMYWEKTYLSQLLAGA